MCGQFQEEKHLNAGVSEKEREWGKMCSLSTVFHQCLQYPTPYQAGYRKDILITNLCAVVYSSVTYSFMLNTLSLFSNIFSSRMTDPCPPPLSQCCFLCPHPTTTSFPLKTDSHVFCFLWAFFSNYVSLYFKYEGDHPVLVFVSD